MQTLCDLVLPQRKFELQLNGCMLQAARGNADSLRLDQTIENDSLRPVTLPPDRPGPLDGSAATSAATVFDLSAPVPALPGKVRIDWDAATARVQASPRPACANGDAAGAVGPRKSPGGGLVRKWQPRPLELTESGGGDGGDGVDGVGAGGGGASGGGGGEGDGRRRADVEPTGGNRERSSFRARAGALALRQLTVSDGEEAEGQEEGEGELGAGGAVSAAAPAGDGGHEEAAAGSHGDVHEEAGNSPGTEPPLIVSPSRMADILSQDGSPKAHHPTPLSATGPLPDALGGDEAASPAVVEPVTAHGQTLSASEGDFARQSQCAAELGAASGLQARRRWAQLAAATAAEPAPVPPAPAPAPRDIDPACGLQALHL
jgi:hypothetical protein